MTNIPKIEARISKIHIGLGTLNFFEGCPVGLFILNIFIYKLSYNDKQTFLITTIFASFLGKFDKYFFETLVLLVNYEAFGKVNVLNRDLFYSVLTSKIGFYMLFVSVQYMLEGTLILV